MADKKIITLKKEQIKPKKVSKRDSMAINGNPEDFLTQKEVEEVKNEISRETLRNVYGNDFEELSNQLKQEENDSKKYFHNIMIDLEEKYQQFNLNMNSHFYDLTNKITEAFKINNNDNEKN